MPVMKIDVILTTFKGGPAYEACIRSLAQELNGFDFRLILVEDGAPSDAAHQIARNHLLDREIVYIAFSERRGVSFARNAALEAATQEQILIIDDDAELLPNTAQALFKILLSDQHIAAVGPKLLFPDRATIFSAEFNLAKLVRLGAGERDFGQRDYQRPVDALLSTCIAARRSALEQVGGFDSRYYPSQGEDIDCCARLRKSGFRLWYTGEVAVIHRHLMRLSQSGDNIRNLTRLRENLADFYQSYPLDDSHDLDIALWKGTQASSAADAAAAIDYLERLKCENCHLFDLDLAIDLYGKTGRLCEAAEACEELLRFRPDDPRLIDRLAQIYDRLGKEEAARRQRLRAFSLLKNIAVQNYS